MTDLPGPYNLPYWPIILYVGNSGPAQLPLPTAPGFVYLIEGIDLYPTIQPNNGDCVVTIDAAAQLGGPFTAYAVQQSQNFPGPFHWRGALPIHDQTGYIMVSGSVPFTFSIWGRRLPDFTQDN
jgi:hypothetical protein